MLGYLFAIRLMRTGASNYVECGSLFTLSFEGLPPFAAHACPRVLLHQPGNADVRLSPLPSRMKSRRELMQAKSADFADSIFVGLGPGPFAMATRTWPMQE